MRPSEAAESNARDVRRSAFRTPVGAARSSRSARLKTERDGTPACGAVAHARRVRRLRRAAHRRIAASSIRRKASPASETGRSMKKARVETDSRFFTVRRFVPAASPFRQPLADHHPSRRLEPDDAYVEPHVSEREHDHEREQVDRVLPEQGGGDHRDEAEQP